MVHAPFSSCKQSVLTPPLWGLTDRKLEAYLKAIWCTPLSRKRSTQQGQNRGRHSQTGHYAQHRLEAFLSLWKEIFQAHSHSYAAMWGSEDGTQEKKHIAFSSNVLGLNLLAVPQIPTWSYLHIYTHMHINANVYVFSILVFYIFVIYILYVLYSHIYIHFNLELCNYIHIKIIWCVLFCFRYILYI